MILNPTKMASNMVDFQKMNRRQFIKTTLVGASALGLTECASIDSSFQSDKKDFLNEVVIVGGGLAGLSTAYALRKNKIPFRLYESEKRFGGRVWSENFGLTEETIELGAEYFTQAHSQLLQLIKELDLAFSEFEVDPKPDFSVLKLGQKIFKLGDLRKEAGNFFSLIHQIKSDVEAAELRSNLNFQEIKRSDLALYYDKLSIKELIDKYGIGIGAIFKTYLDLIFENNYGVKSDRVCCLEFVKNYSDGKVLVGFKEKKILYKIPKGNSSLIQAIHSRIKSVIPNHVVKKEHKLEAITFRDSSFNLRFATNQGVRIINAKVLVLALPVSSLSDIYGFSGLKLSFEKESMIKNHKYVNQSKIFWGLKERVNQLGVLNRYPLVSDSPCQTLKLSSGKLSSNGDIVLESLRSGVGLNQPFNPQKTLDELELFEKNIRSHLNYEVRYINWGHQPGLSGSFIYTAPGSYFNSPIALGSSEYNGQLLFAGEHTSLNFRNTMEGAIESGLRAAREAAEGLKKISEKRTV